MALRARLASLVLPPSANRGDALEPGRRGDGSAGCDRGGYGAGLSSFAPLVAYRRSCARPVAPLPEVASRVAEQPSSGRSSDVTWEDRSTQVDGDFSSNAANCLDGVHARGETRGPCTGIRRL